MWQTKATLWSLLLLVSFGTCSPETSPLPYGLLFTPSSILASIQSPEGKTYVTHFDPPAEYLAYYADAVAHYHNHVYYNYTWYLQDARTDELIETRPDENVFDQSPANEMFKTIIETVDRSMKENYFDRQVLLSQESIFMPSIFNESSRVAAMTGALNSDIGLQGVVFNHGSISKAAVYAYGLDKCENFGWGKEVCEDHKEHPADLVLVVEYEKDYLFLELVHSDLERKFGYFWKLEPEMLLDFGEESGRLMREVRRCYPILFDIHSRAETSANSLIENRPRCIYSQTPSRDQATGQACLRRHAPALKERRNQGNDIRRRSFGGGDE